MLKFDKYALVRALEIRSILCPESNFTGGVGGDTEGYHLKNK